MPRVSRSLVALVPVVLAAGACTSGIKEIQVADASNSLQLVADSTTHLAAYAALATDTAMVKVRVATTASSLTDARSLVLTARTAVVSASSNATAAIRQGDWLRNIVAGDAADDQGGRDYARYWTIGRAKLDSARTLSGEAAAVADSALSCTERLCAAARVRQMQAHVEAAAGAAREAESVIRVAMVHVR